MMITKIIKVCPLKNHRQDLEVQKENLKTKINSMTIPPDITNY